MTDPHPTDALVEKLRHEGIGLTIREIATPVIREWYDENVAPMVRAFPMMEYARERAEEAEAKLKLARTLLGNTLYNVEQTEPGCESEKRLRESLAGTAERIGLSREKRWR